MLKITVIHWGLIPGGVASYARCLESFPGFTSIKFNSICITDPKWPIDEAAVAETGMEIIPIKSRLDPTWFPALRKRLFDLNSHLILTHGFNGVFVAAIAGKGLGIPIVSSWHGDYFPSTLAQRFKKPLFDILLIILYKYVVKEIVTVSAFSRKTLVTKGICEDKIRVIYNGIPPHASLLKQRQKIRETLNVPENCFLIGTACRLVAPKGLEWFLRAMAIISKDRNDVRFVIWGDGPLKDELQTLASNLGLGSLLQLPGYRSDIVDCLSALDVFVMSSAAENFSLTLLEAMRASLPIVATRVGGNPEAIEDGVHGILVPFADAQALASDVMTLLSDDALRQAMAAKARERYLNEFTSDIMVEKTAQWLMECAGKHSLQMSGEVSP